MKSKNEEITFKDILSIFIPKIWIIAIASVVLAIVFATYSVFMVPDTYTATSKMNIRKNTDPNVMDIQATDSVIETVSSYVYATDFCENICAYMIREYGEKYNSLSSAQVRGAISYIPKGNGNLVLSVTTGNMQLTVGIAKALEEFVPDEFYDYSSVFKVETVEHAPELISPNPKNPVVKAIIGFFIGAVISAVVVWIYSVLDVTVRDKKKLEDNFDIPVLGTIPMIKKEAASGKEVN